MKINCVSSLINNYPNNSIYSNKPEAFTGLNFGFNKPNISHKIKDFYKATQNKNTGLYDSFCSKIKSFYKDHFCRALKIIFAEKPLCLDNFIEFIPATNINDAILFAKNKLKIENFHIEDLDFANNINAALVNVSNFFNGKVYFPKTIDYTKEKDVYACYNFLDDKLLINRNLIIAAQEDLEEIIKNESYSEAIKGNFGFGYEKYCKLMKQAYKNPSVLSFFDKYSLLETYKNKEELLENIKEKISLKDKINLNPYCPIFEDFNSLIYHEIGHCFYDKSTDLLTNIYNLSIFDAWVKPTLMLEDSKEDLDEFIANIFAGKIRGEHFSNEVENKFQALTEFNT